jgi:peptidoglycan/LPS O-acetylase OafA/YrhL
VRARRTQRAHAAHTENPLVALSFPPQVLWMFINNATVSVDTFFVMSGFLLCYLFLERMKKTNGKSIKSVQFWIMYYVHRYIRLERGGVGRQKEVRV